MVDAITEFAPGKNYNLGNAGLFESGRKYTLGNAGKFTRADDGMTHSWRTRQQDADSQLVQDHSE